MDSQNEQNCHERGVTFAAMLISIRTSLISL